MNKLFSRKGGDNRSSELPQLESNGKRYKHACQEAQKAFEKSHKLQQALVEQSKAVAALFDELSAQLSECDAALGAELKLAAEWQTHVGEFLAGHTASMDAFAKRSKAFVDKDYADTKKVADAYDKKRLAFNAAEQKCAKLAKAAGEPLKDAERERADAKAAFEAAEADTLAHWQAFGSAGADLVRSCLAAYMKDYATYHKQGHLYFDAKRAAQEGVFCNEGRVAALSPRRPSAAPSSSASGAGGAAAASAPAAAGSSTMSMRELAASKPTPTPTPSAAPDSRGSLGAMSAGSAQSSSTPDDDADLLDRLTSTIDSAEASLGNSGGGGSSSTGSGSAATANRPRQFAGARPAMPGVDLNAAVARRPSVPGNLAASAGASPNRDSGHTPAKPTRVLGPGGPPRTQYQSLPSAPSTMSLPIKPGGGGAATAAAPAKAAATSAAAKDALAELDDFLEGGDLEELAPLDDEF